MPALFYVPPAINAPASSRYSGLHASSSQQIVSSQAGRNPFALAAQDDVQQADFLVSLGSLVVPEEGEEPITTHALTYTMDLIAPILASISLMRDAPRVVDDGEGGVRITWRSFEKELRAVIPGFAQGAHYIYWETENEYGTNDNLTELSLLHYLGWMHGRNLR